MRQHLSGDCGSAVELLRRALVAVGAVLRHRAEIDERSALLRLRDPRARAGAGGGSPSVTRIARSMAAPMRRALFSA